MLYNTLRLLKNNYLNLCLNRAIRIRRKELPISDNFFSNPTTSEDLTTDKNIKNNKNKNDKTLFRQKEIFNFDYDKKPAKKSKNDFEDLDNPNYKLRFDKPKNNKFNNRFDGADSKNFNKNNFNDKNKYNKNNIYDINNIYNLKSDKNSVNENVRQFPNKYDKKRETSFTDNLRNEDNRKSPKGVFDDARKHSRDYERKHTNTSDNWFSTKIPDDTLKNPKNKKNSPRGNTARDNQKNPAREFPTHFDRNVSENSDWWVDENPAKKFSKKSNDNFESFKNEYYKDIDRERSPKGSFETRESSFFGERENIFDRQNKESQNNFFDLKNAVKFSFDDEQSSFPGERENFNTRQNKKFKNKDVDSKNVENISFSKTRENIIDKPIKHPKTTFLDSLNTGEPSFSIVVKDKIIEAENIDISHFELHNDILNLLKSLEISKFSSIQFSSFSPIKNRRDVYICAQTGSGKTLAYILPILSNIVPIKKPKKSTYQKNYESIPEDHSNIPEDEYFNKIPDNHINLSNLILVPNMTLVSQLMTTMHLVNEHTDAQTCNLMSMSDMYDKNNANFYVSTYGRLNDLVKNKKIDFNKISTIIVDEADIMLTDHLHKMFSFFAKLQKEFSFQLVFASSTLPSVEILKNLTGLFKNLTFLKSNNHKLVSQQTFYFRKINQGDKTEFLIESLKLFVADKRIIMIFVEKITTSIYLHKTLLEAGFNNVLLNSENTNLRQDLKKLGRSVRIAVCTDLLSRGLDFYVDTIINFDYPRDRATFINRAGRTGRMFHNYYNNPIILTFLSKNWHVNEAREIQENTKNNKEII